MQYLNLLLRIILSFSILWLGLRLLGKKQFGELTITNIAIAFAIGEMASDLATNINEKPWPFVLAMIGYFLLALGIGYISLKSRRLRGIFEGHPTLLIAHGKILEDNLKRMKMSVDILLQKLREKDAFRVQEIEYAILEANGKLTVMFMPPYEPLTADNLKIKTQYKGLLIDVIADGKILGDNLRKIGLTRSWLNEQIQKEHIQSIAEVFLAQVDKNGKLYLDLKKDWEEAQNPI
ncbi:YetF domain-containing protein [Desulfitobacterium sp. AusDCA]|uniref:YetF domain-containing protein n=1 Tax=Desulfitobacterium sp. AusDCA TaxID=3240383 RepID=UPI003DA782F5